MRSRDDAVVLSEFRGLTARPHGSQTQQIGRKRQARPMSPTAWALPRVAHARGSGRQTPHENRPAWDGVKLKRARGKTISPPA
jgi:hypothetical protein